MPIGLSLDLNSIEHYKEFLVVAYGTHKPPEVRAKLKMNILGEAKLLAAKVCVDSLRIACSPLVDLRCARCLVSQNRHPLKRRLCATCNASPPAEASGSRANDDGDNRIGVAVAAAMRGAPKAAPGAYDAIVLLSGGKDSLYMLLRLRAAFPELRLLSVSFDNGFLNALSYRNIEIISKATGVDNLFVRPDIAIYRAIIAYAIRHSGKIGCYRADSMDGAIFRDLTSSIAVERSIPLVFSGHTAAQTHTILSIDDCVLPPALLEKDRSDYFGVPVKAIFTDDTTHVWKGSQHDPARIPRWVFPLQAWKPSQQNIESYLAENGNFSPSQVKQFFTGNDLQAVFMLHDYRSLGYFSYEEEAAIMLRANRVNRREWRRIYALMEIVAKSDQLTRLVVEPTLKTLGLDFEELFINPAARDPGQSH